MPRNGLPAQLEFIKRRISNAKKATSDSGSLCWNRAGSRFRSTIFATPVLVHIAAIENGVPCIPVAFLINAFSARSAGIVERAVGLFVHVLLLWRKIKSIVYA